jgi:H+/gluconate symporter-like permease
VHPAVAILPLFVVGIGNFVFTQWLFPALYTGTVSVTLTEGGKTISQDAAKLLGIWSVEAALVLGIVTVALFAFPALKDKFIEGSKTAVAGSLLAALNTASEYGFGSVIASLPGFVVIKNALAAIPNPLVNEAITVSTLAGVTGSASGGMGIALAAMADRFKEAATAAGIPFELLHRVAAMASGGMDTLPHNGAVITLLAVTGLTHRQSYRDIFAITCIKTSAVFVIIAIYYLTGLV